MDKSQFKTIKISPELHKRIKTFCNKESYKLNEWIEKQLKQVIEKIENKNNE